MRGALDYDDCLYADRKLSYSHICPACGYEQIDGADQTEWICGKCGESYKLCGLNKLEAIKDILNE